MSVTFCAIEMLEKGFGTSTSDVASELDSFFEGNKKTYYFYRLSFIIFEINRCIIISAFRTQIFDNI